MNALAAPQALLPEGPDGTVMLGLRFITAEIEVMKRNSLFWARNYGADQAYAQVILVIIAHEFGHVFQYKKGLRPRGSWQMEPHADFMAGWLLAQNGEANKIFLTANIESAVMTIFGVGDTLFNSEKHHGTPEFRTAMLQAGYSARELNADQAFVKGEEMSHLNELDKKWYVPGRPKWYDLE